MKQFLIGLPDGGENLISVKREGKRFEVTFGERKFTFTEEEIGNTRISARIQNGHFLISSPDLQRCFDCKPQRPGSRKSEAQKSQGPQNLKALFPGKVVKVSARVKQWAEAGELLLVMESMKMEYSYRAPKKIFIEEILVAEGQQISKGDEFFRTKEPQ